MDQQETSDGSDAPYTLRGLAQWGQWAARDLRRRIAAVESSYKDAYDRGYHDGKAAERERIQGKLFEEGSE